MAKTLKIDFTYLLPEIWTLAISGALAYFIYESNVYMEAITIFPETIEGSTLNTLLFIALMAATATLMYLLLKRGLTKVLKLLIKVALVFTIFPLANWYSEIYLTLIGVKFQTINTLAMAVAISITAILSYSIYRRQGLTQIIAITIVGALIGTFLGASIPALTAQILLLALVVYDFFAVLKGPIGKMADKANLDEFVGAVFTFRDLTIGLGDLVFYSMLASNAMINFGVLPSVAASTGIIVGAYFGFKMLKKRNMFPGLPFSLTLGLAFMLTAVYMQKAIWPI